MEPSNKNSQIQERDIFLSSSKNNNEEIGLSHFNTEILIEIFKNLGVPELAQTCKVDKQWEILSTDDEVWKAVIKEKSSKGEHLYEYNL